MRFATNKWRALPFAPPLQQLLESVRGIITNTSWLVATTALNAVLGLAYWGAAARFFPPDIVGVAAASVTAMILISTFGMLGFGSLLLGGISQRASEAPALIATALITTGLVSGGLGIGTALLAPFVSRDFAFLRHDPATIAIFTLGGVLLTVSLVLNQALIGRGRGSWQFWQNAAMAATKLLLIVAIGFGGWWPISWLTIYLTWVIAMLVSLLGLGLFALTRGGALASYRPRWRLLRGMGRQALDHHIINLALLLPGQILPLIVTAILSSTENAYYYTAWQFAGFIFAPPVALSISLYATANGTSAALRRRLRFTLSAAFAIGVAANIVAYFGGGIALSLYGADYAREALWPLRIIGIGVFPLIVKDHYVALCRIKGHLGGAIPLIIGGSLLELLLAAYGGTRAQLNGLVLGWLAAVCIEAILMAWPLIRAVVGKQPHIAAAAQQYLPWWAQAPTD